MSSDPLPPQPDLDQLRHLVDDFLAASIRDWTGRAARMLARDPWIAGYDFRAAVVLGDAARAGRMLARDPELATAADPRTGWTPLLCAVAGEANAGITALLLEHGARPDDHALYLAAFDASHECLRLLLPYAPDIAATTALSAPISTGDVTAALLAADPHLASQLTADDYRALAGAAGMGATEAVRLMLDLGFPPGSRSGADDGATALHLAAAAGSPATVRLLLERGADIEARDAAWDSTPLEWAIVGSGLRLGHDPSPDWPATVSALLDAGASTGGIVLSPDDPKPPSPEVAALLRARGIPGEEASTAGG